MGSLIKTKAIFEILVIVLSIFSISLMNVKEVSAENKVCCEKTLDNAIYNGESCIYTEPGNCANGNNLFGVPYQSSNLACEQTSYCKPVCCIKEGECVTNTYKTICLNQGGAPIEDATCNVESCQEGCCVLPDQAMFTTEVECSNLIEDYSGLVLSDVFNPTITDEYTCLQQAQNQEEGCCVKPNECSWGTRAECTSSGTFYDNTLCSYAPLGCLVTEKHHVGCLDGKEEVYWFDSANNPENIYGTPYRTDGKKVSKELSCNPSNPNIESLNCGNCNYDLGSICSPADNGFLTAVDQSNSLSSEIKSKLDFMCTDLNCYEEDLYTDDVNKDRWADELHTASDGRKYRANGESWCQYEGKTGYGYDLVGSRQYRRYCVNGNETFEPCDEKRETICVQNVIPQSISGIAGGISGAVCTANLASPCFGTTEEPIDNKEDCENLEAYCYWNENRGVCLPMVAPGGFEEDDSSACFGDITAVEFWTKEWGDWECEGNCFVSQKSFANDMFSICRSLGDCGDYYNVIGEASDGAGDYKTGSFKITKQRGHAQAGSPDGYDFYPITNFDENNLKIANEYINGSLFWLVFVGKYSLARAMTNDFPEQTALRDSLIALGGGLGLAGLFAALSSVTTFTEILTLGLYSNSLIGIVGPLGPLAGVTGLAAVAVVAIVVVIIMAVVFAIEALFFRESDEVPFTFTCENWVPLSGGENCNKCSDFTKCDEYKCMSLGAGCKFVNDNGEEACIWENPGDAIPPIISIMPIVPNTLNDFIITPVGQGNAQSGLNGGYEFKEQIEYATDLELGINTNERASCKITDMPGQTYEQMTTYFGANGYFYNHTITIESKSVSNEDEIAITGAGDYTFYVKCKDASNGNENLHDYFIKFNVKEGQDIMAPIIEDTSIVNGAYMPHNKQNTSLTLYLDDQTGINGCKYSREFDKDYSLMEHKLTCLTSQINDNYLCSTNINITLNQDNKYYFKCNDTLGNFNTQGYEYLLKSTDSLYITNSAPTGEVLTTQVNLQATTSGGAEAGKAKCYYSLDSFFDPNGLLFSTTDSTTHTTPLFLQNEQDYLFYLWCRDIAGNEDTKEISFYTTTPDLNITNVEPENNSIFYLDNFILEVTTIGGVNENGESDCSYDGTLIPDKEIGTSQTIHTKNITGLSNGDYEWEIVCVDSIGVEDSTNLKFKVELNSAPFIIGIYTTSNTLNIMLNRNGICRYSNTDGNFDFEDGEGNPMIPATFSTSKSAALGNSIYYIKCEDSYGNNNNNNPYIIFP